MSSDNSTRDPDVVAFERTYPGVTATNVTVWPRGYEFACEGPGETLVSVGLISPAMLERMAGTCTQIQFGPRPNRKDNFCPFYTQLRYRTDAGRPTGTLRMRRYLPYRDEGHVAEMLAFCELIGTKPPTQADMDAANAKLAHDVAIEKAIREVAQQTAARQVRPTWTTDGVVINVDWKAIQRRVLMQRQAEAS